MTAKPRFREMDGQSGPTSVSYAVHYFGPPPLQTDFNGSVVSGSYSGRYKSISDMTDTDYVKTSDPSRWVANPCTINVLDIKTSNTSTTTSNVPDAQGRGITRTWSGDGVGYIFGPLVPSRKSMSFGTYPDLFDASRVSDRAVIKCMADVNAAKALSWVTAAEGKKTVNMVFDRARKLAAVYAACRHGDLAALKVMFPNLKKASPPKRVILWDENGQPIVRKNGKLVHRYSHKTLSKKEFRLMPESDRLWLEYRYGWSPLVFDIQSQMKAIYAQDLRDELSPKNYERVIASDKREATQSTNLFVPNKDGGSWTGHQTITHKVVANAYAKFQVQDESGFMNRAHEFGIFDIPLTLWELVPYSFVVDWFIPIGTWLQAVQPKFGVKMLDSGVTVKHSKSVTRSVVGYAPSATGIGSWPSAPVPIGASDGFDAFVYTRTTSLSVPLLPVPDVKLNVQRIADAVALLKVQRQSNLRI